MRRHGLVLIITVLTLLCHADWIRAQQNLAGAESLYQQTTGVTWRSPDFSATTTDVRLIGFNDLHGRLFAPPVTSERSRISGGAAALASYIAAARREYPKRTLTLIAGDSIGATQMASALLNDEPTLAVLDELADGECPRLSRDTPTTRILVTKCRTIATVGNHELDHGTAAFERQLYGNAANDTHQRPWHGVHVPFIAANILKRRDETPFLPPAAIVEMNGVKIGVIGAITHETSSLVASAGISQIRIETEAPSINAAVDKLQAAGAHTIVLVIHEGLESPNTVQIAPRARDELSGGLVPVLADIHGVDVVIAGHTHQLNAVLTPLGDGSMTLVMQARSYGAALSLVDLTIDTSTGKVLAKSGRIIDTYADQGPGRAPIKAVSKIIAQADVATRQTREEVIGEAATSMRRGTALDPETALGDLVADAQRAALSTDVAFVNAGGLRSDLPKGPITVATVFDIEPFGNRIIKLALSGEQITRLLEEQWPEGKQAGRFLRVSGIRYHYDATRPHGHHVVDVTTDDGQALERDRLYTVAANDFIVGGGDHFTVLAESLEMTPGPLDREVLTNYIRHHGGAIEAPPQQRVQSLARPAR